MIELAVEFIPTAVQKDDEKQVSAMSANPGVITVGEFSTIAPVVPGAKITALPFASPATQRVAVGQARDESGIALSMVVSGDVTVTAVAVYVNDIVCPLLSTTVQSEDEQLSAVKSALDTVADTGAPPGVYRYTAPASPTATQRVAVAQPTAFTCSGVAAATMLVIDDEVTLKLTITPPVVVEPTAVQVVEDGHDTPKRLSPAATALSAPTTPVAGSNTIPSPAVSTDVQSVDETQATPVTVFVSIV